MTKKENSFEIRVVILIKGRVSIGDFCDRGSVYMRDVVRIFVSFLSFYFRYIVSLVHWSCDYLVIAFIVLIFDIYIYIYI